MNSENRMWMIVYRRKTGDLGICDMSESPMKDMIDLWLATMPDEPLHVETADYLAMGMHTHDEAEMLAEVMALLVGAIGEAAMMENYASN